MRQKQRKILSNAGIYDFETAQGLDEGGLAQAETASLHLGVVVAGYRAGRHRWRYQ